MPIRLLMNRASTTIPFFLLFIVFVINDWNKFYCLNRIIVSYFSMIDCHAHMACATFCQNLSDKIEEAKNSGVTGVIVVPVRVEIFVYHTN